MLNRERNPREGDHVPQGARKNRKNQNTDHDRAHQIINEVNYAIEMRKENLKMRMMIYMNQIVGMMILDMYQQFHLSLL